MAEPAKKRYDKQMQFVNTISRPQDGRVRLGLTAGEALLRSLACRLWLAATNTIALRWVKLWRVAPC